MFGHVDHIAIVVPDTEEALKTWRDKFGLEVVHSEQINNDTLLLTHLDAGNVQLQLVEPLAAEHPLRTWVMEHGAGLHHFCFQVESVPYVQERLSGVGLNSAEDKPHQGPNGKVALFIDPSGSDGVQVEITG